MTTNTTSEPIAPATDPIRKDGDRRVTAKWPIGPVGADGYQSMAVLTVDHDKDRKAYFGTLNTRREKSTRIEFRLGVRGVRILHQPTARYRETTLLDLYADALADLRYRFNAGDTDIVAFFDPTSAVYTA
jgi:hypothetical protein